MLAQLRADIKAKLEGAYPFRIVEPGFSQRALQSPPAAVFVLTKDGKVCDEPEVVRKLIYEIALLVNYTDPVKAQIEMESIIDVAPPGPDPVVSPGAGLRTGHGRRLHAARGRWDPADLYGPNDP